MSTNVVLKPKMKISLKMSKGQIGGENLEWKGIFYKENLKQMFIKKNETAVFHFDL